MPNYQRELDTIIAALDGKRPRLLLHVCCAPCLAYVQEYLSPHFDITLFWCNPNIQPQEEYYRRLAEIAKLPPLPLIEDEYVQQDWGDCAECQAYRLRKTAELAAADGYDYFCTTLTISPHKNAARLNAMGAALSAELSAKWLPSDFKKRGGFVRSAAICRERGIYRQTWCGCAAMRGDTV